MDHKQDTLVTQKDWHRAFISDKNISMLDARLYSKTHLKDMIGLIIFMIVFAFLIPHVLLQKKKYIVAIAYLCNLDIVATILGFSGGPYNIWKYLYNPNTETFFGFFSSTLINYFAVCGVGYVAIKYAMKHKNAYAGLAKMLIAIPITYLLPGNFIVFLMNNVAHYLFEAGVSYYVRWIVTIICGVIFGIGIISFEVFLTEISVPNLIKIVDRIFKIY